MSMSAILKIFTTSYLRRRWSDSHEIGRARANWCKLRFQWRVEGQT